MYLNVIDAFYRFVASGSTSEPEIFCTGSQRSATRQAGFGVVNGADESHHHGQRLAIWGDWSGFTIVDRLGAQIELISHLLGAANRLPTGAARDLVHLAIFLDVTKPNAQLDLLSIAS